MRVKRPSRARLAALSLAVSPGAAAAASPSVTAFGAYFPAWLLCIVVGVIAALLTHAVLVRTALNAIVPLQPLLCLSTGVLAAVLTSLLWIGR